MALQCGRVFEFFYWPALAADSHRHHCLAAVRGNMHRTFPSFARPWNRTPRMYKLYSMQRSGNSYKVRLALALLNQPYEAVEVDILRGESRTPDFLTKNPSGQVPLLEVGNDRYLA